MRTSHLALRRRIENEKLKITDEELFAGGAFSGYLSDIAEAATKRYKRHTAVQCFWDESPEAHIAYTDNRKICVNAANYITQSFPTRMLRADSLVGMTGHEIGHILFTDFQMRDLYGASLKAGRMYPSEPTGLTTKEQIYLSELKQVYDNDDEVAVMALVKAALYVNNILEDVYIEARMTDAFPGIYRTGILLNSSRQVELVPSIKEQQENGYHEYAIVINLLLQYCRSGDVNNLGGYTGPYLNALYDCIPTIDEALYNDDARERYTATNILVIKLWPYIKQLIEKFEEEIQNGKMVEEALNELEKQITSGDSIPSGSTKPVRCKKFYHDPQASTEEQEAIQQVVDYETGRLALEKTDSFEEGDDGSLTLDRDYAGTGYASSASDVVRILNQVAEEKTYRLLDEELSAELQTESDKIRYGNAHKGVDITLHRMSVVPQELIAQYQQVAPPIMLLSKRLQKKVQTVLKEKREGGKQTGLLMGRRLDARAVIRDDGRLFYKNRLPQEKADIAVALLVDESGSMASNDRISTARAAALVLHDFCRSLGLPVIVYGHSTGYDDVELYAYAEFDSIDGRDKYRIMDMSARGGNRDGAALRFVAERLSRRDEETKILILVSDGQPADTNYYGTEAEADLRGIKREYNNKDILMFAAAIGDDKPNIQRIYKDGFLDITNLHKLPANLTRLISQYIK